MRKLFSICLLMAVLIEILLICLFFLKQVNLTELVLIGLANAGSIYVFILNLKRIKKSA